MAGPARLAGVPDHDERRLLILTEGQFGPHHGKTAMGVIRYGREPIAAVLDSTLVGEVLVVMEDLAHEGATMIVVTHEMAFAREAADRVYFIDQGRFVEVGPPEEVIDAPRDPRTIEFLARTHGTGAHVHGGVAVAAAPVAGLLLGLVMNVSAVLLSALFAFLAGGIILNVLKEELPEDRRSRFRAFALGATSYAALLLLTA